MAMEVSVVGFDIAKNVFQVDGVIVVEQPFCGGGCGAGKCLSFFAT